MSLKWIAAELPMGSWTHVSKLLGQKKAIKVNSKRVFVMAGRFHRHKHWKCSGFERFHSRHF